MNGSSPLTSGWVPGGSGGAGCAGTGEADLGPRHGHAGPLGQRPPGQRADAARGQRERADLEETAAIRVGAGWARFGRGPGGRDPVEWVAFCWWSGRPCRPARCLRRARRLRPARRPRPARCSRPGRGPRLLREPRSAGGPAASASSAGGPAAGIASAGPAPAGTGRPRPLGTARALRRPDQAGQRERPGQRAEQRGQHVHQFGVRPGQRAGQADHGEDAEPEVAVAEPPHGRDADDRGQHREHHEHAEDQGLLVVRAERGDREVLDRGRSIVDGQTADGRHRRALRPAYPGDELGNPERDPGGEQANPHATADPRGTIRSFHRSHS